MRFAFAGDRQVSVNMLDYLIEKGHHPLALLVVSDSKATHQKALIESVSVDAKYVFKGKEFNSEENIKALKALNLDYIIGVHFPYIIPNEVLSIPKIGFLNLHPSYLPYNKGWHTPSWAILEGTPYGATLHFMSKQLDEGDVIHQKRIEIGPTDTANSLYAKVLKLEEKVFIEALPDLVSLKPNRTKQTHLGTSHTRKELKNMQKIDENKNATYGEMIDRLRALTTNDISEASYIEKDGKKYAIQIVITEVE